MYYEKLIEREFIFEESCDNFSGSGYIMNDGKFLSLTLNKEKFDDGTPHPNFDNYLIKIENPGSIIPRLLKHKDNAVHIDDKGVDLPENILTEEQMASLLSLINKFASSDKKVIVVDSGFAKEKKKVFNLEESLPEDVITYIRSLY